MSRIANIFSESGSIPSEVNICLKYLTLESATCIFSLLNLIPIFLAHSRTFMGDWSCSKRVFPYFYKNNDAYCFFKVFIDFPLKLIL